MYDSSAGVDREVDAEVRDFFGGIVFRRSFRATWRRPKPRATAGA